MTADVHLHDPQTLYRCWEDGQWTPFDIDLDADRPEPMSGEDRGLVLWALASLMVAEERITTKFAGLVLAHGSEEEATFLATQQVDEARHMQFYARFQNEVVADPRAIADHALVAGFRAGYGRIHHDEQRHIAYGIWYLRRAVAEAPELAETVRETLRGLLPAVAQAPTPPDREGTDWRALGASAEEIRDFALRGLTRRLEIVGVPPATVVG